MRHITICITLSALCACANPVELIVDSACSDTEIDAIQEALDNVNDVLGEEAYTIGTISDIDYDGTFDDMVVCTGGEWIDRWPALEGFVGRKTGTNIFIRTDRELSYEGMLHIMMHEMIHLIGAPDEEHSDDPLDVFFGSWTDDKVVEYSEYDRAIMLNYY